MKTRALVPALLALSVLAGQLSAQASSAYLPKGPAIGVTIDRFSFDAEAGVTSATLHVSSLRPNKVTTEFGLMVVPTALAQGFFIGDVDVGGAINIPFPHAMLLLRGGGSGIFAFGGGAGALPGAHYGASLLMKVAGGSAIRIDLLRRIYFLPYDFRSGIATFSLGVGISSLPRL